MFLAAQNYSANSFATYHGNPAVAEGAHIVAPPAPTRARARRRPRARAGPPMPKRFCSPLCGDTLIEIRNGTSARGHQHGAQRRLRRTLMRPHAPRKGFVSSRPEWPPPPKMEVQPLQPLHFSAAVSPPSIATRAFWSTVSCLTRSRPRLGPRRAPLSTPVGPKPCRAC